MKSIDLLRERYLRQLLLEDIGEKGQIKLSKAKVLVIGVGGLGSPVCSYLSAAGVGKIGIVDCDVVEVENLQRQVIHFTGDIGKSKVSSASVKMKSINPNVVVETYFDKFTNSNGHGIAKNYDFIVDATDNFVGKFLINDICIEINKPFSHASVLKYQGRVMTIIPNETACFRCVFNIPSKEELESVSIAGLFGVLPGIVGCIQASEAIKYILELGELLTDVVLSLDIRTMDFRKVKVQKDLKCLVCSA